MPCAVVYSARGCLLWLGADQQGCSVLGCSERFGVSQDYDEEVRILERATSVYHLLVATGVSPSEFVNRSIVIRSKLNI